MKPAALPRSFKILLAGKAVSDFGSWLDFVALTSFALHITGSGFATGLFMATRVCSGAIAGLYNGILTDRYSRKKLLIVADLARCGALFGLAATPASLSLPMLLLTGVVLGVCTSLFNVALGASIPAIVGIEHRSKANGLLTAATSIAMAAGFSITGPLVSFLGYAGAFFFDGTTYLISAVNIHMLTLTTESDNQAPQMSRRGGIGDFFKRLVELRDHLRAIPALLLLLGIRQIDAFGSASHNVGFPVLSAQLRPEQPTMWMGYILSIWALGKAAAGGFRWNLGARSLERWFLLATIGMSAAFIGLFWSARVIPLLLFALGAGVCDGLSEIVLMSRIQEADDLIRGRIFGVWSTLQSSGFGVGMILCSALLKPLGAAWMVTWAHGIPILVCLAALQCQRRRRSLAPQSLPAEGI